MRVALMCAVWVGCAKDEPIHSFPPGGYQLLSETDLFDSMGSDEVADDLLQFTAGHVLWSDGAEKARYLRVPPGEVIDTSDMDHWQLPVGAQLFKSFRRDGVLVETRLIERIALTGDRDDDYWVGAFVWRDDGSDAELVPDGMTDARGTDHDVPGQKMCWNCHRGQPGAVLGLSLVQLSAADDGAALAELADRHWLSRDPEALYQPPGGSAARQALGYLHGNCSHCHNPRGSARIDTDMNLELLVSDDVAELTSAYQTTVGVELQYWTETQDQYVYRIVAGDPSTSGLLHRMSERGAETAMPPIATERVDPDGLTIIETWIESL